MDAIDLQIEEVNKTLQKYRKALDQYTTVFPVNPCGYESEPLLSLGSKEDLVIDALKHYNLFLQVRISTMDQMIILSNQQKKVS